MSLAPQSYICNSCGQSSANTERWYTIRYTHGGLILTIQPFQPLKGKQVKPERHGHACGENCLSRTVSRIVNSWPNIQPQP